MDKKKSIFQQAGEWGLPFGLYLSCGAIAFIFADWFPPLALVFFVIMLCTPLVSYYFQRRRFIQDDGFTEYAALWMLGIMLYLLGGVLASLVAYLILQYGRPGFIEQQAIAAIDVYSKMPQMKDSEMLRVLQMMIDKKMLPTPIEMVFNVFWFVAFFGSVISAITALIAQRSLPRRRNSQQ
jgi:hypothetical protein